MGQHSHHSPPHPHPPPQLVELRGQESEVSHLLWVSPLEALLRHETPSEACTLPQPSFSDLASAWQARHAARGADAPPEESTFDLTPGSKIRDGDGRGVEFFTHPERLFHNIVPHGAFPAGHYTAPLGSNTTVGAEIQYVGVYVGGAAKSLRPRRITFLKE